MNFLRYITIACMLTLAFTCEIMAKPVKPEHVYMFGFSASFTDSTIYVTDIQDVQGAWIDSKTKFLLGRDNYSYQLKGYFTEKMQQPNRICMVFFATSKRKIEKAMKKLMKKYVPDTKTKKKKKQQTWRPYDVNYLTSADFKFEAIDMSDQQK